jgi:hypothetical protein
MRLALLLAALAVAGPSVSAQPAFETARAGVSIAWFRVTPASRPQLEMKQAGLTTRRHAVQVESCASPDVVLPDTLRAHSLFQRPPPLHS